MVSDIYKFVMALLGWLVLIIFSYFTTPQTKLVKKGSKDFNVVFSNNISLIHALVLIFLTSKIQFDDSINDYNNEYINELIIVN